MKTNVSAGNAQNVAETHSLTAIQIITAMTVKIEYTVYLKSGDINGKMRIKNCMDTLHAQIRLEGYLMRKHKDFKQLVVHSAREEFDIDNAFGGIFKDIFK